MSALADAGALDRRARWHDRPRAQLQRAQSDRLHPFLGKDLAPPADAPDQREGDADETHGGVRDEAGEGQRDAQGDDHRRRRRRRKLDPLGSLRVLVVRGRHILSSASSPRRSGR